MFNKAIRWGYMSDNPCNRADTPRYEAAERPILTTDEISRIVELLPQEELKYQAIFYFAALDSMRRQEIIALRRSCIDFDNDTFYIREAAYLDEHGRCELFSFRL